MICTIVPTLSGFTTGADAVMLFLEVPKSQKLLALVRQSKYGKKLCEKYAKVQPTYCDAHRFVHKLH